MQFVGGKWRTPRTDRSGYAVLRVQSGRATTRRPAQLVYCSQNGFCLSVASTSEIQQAIVIFVFFLSPSSHSNIHAMA